MIEWVKIPDNGGTAPQTWVEGTQGFSFSENLTASQNQNNGTPEITNSTGTTASVAADYTFIGDTNNFTEVVNRYVFSANQTTNLATIRNTSSIVEQNFFDPSTVTELVAAQTDSSGGSTAAFTSTVTMNYTLSTVVSTADLQTAYTSSADTSYSNSYASNFGTTDGTYVVPAPSDTDGNPLPTSASASHQRTNLGAIERILSTNETLGSSIKQTSTAQTNTDTPYNNTAWTTYSTSVSQSTNSTRTASSISSWDLSQGVPQMTSHSTVTTDLPITYAGDKTGYNSSASSTTGTNSSGTISGSFSVPVTNETVTNHAYSQKVDTVILMKGGRNLEDYNLGEMLWKFSRSDIAASASSAGRFTDFYHSTGSPTVTISDFEKYSTFSVAATEISVSQNTSTSTTSTITGTLPATFTASTSTIVMLTSKNGTRWNEYSTINVTNTTGGGTSTGTVTGIGLTEASSNFRTESYVFGVGAVGTSLSTYTFASTGSVYSETIFTHSIQVTGYNDSFQWTSSTETALFGTSSFTESRLALWNSTSSTIEIASRATSLVSVFINSYSSYLVGTDTNYFYLGKVSTQSTRVFESSYVTSRSIYESLYNPEIDRFTTVSSRTIDGGAEGETSAVSDEMKLTYYTKYRLQPAINTTPNGFGDGFSGDGSNYDIARFSVLPYGYAGFGGTFEASALAVKFTVEAGLVGGSAFSGQSMQFEELPTVSAYPGVTLYPVDPGLTFDMPGAARASYVAALSSIGTATVAVTWTSTTTATTSSGTASQVTSRLATYTLAGVSSIGGTFFSEENLSIHSEESFQLIGGYAVGDNNLGHPYTVVARSGFAQWTEYSAGQSTASASFSTSGSNGSVSFTVAGNNAIVFQIEPIFTANWTDAGEIPFYFSSTPHVRTP